MISFTIVSYKCKYVKSAEIHATVILTENTTVMIVKCSTYIQSKYKRTKYKRTNKMIKRNMIISNYNSMITKLNEITNYKVRCVQRVQLVLFTVWLQCMLLHKYKLDLLSFLLP